MFLLKCEVDHFDAAMRPLQRINRFSLLRREGKVFFDRLDQGFEAFRVRVGLRTNHVGKASAESTFRKEKTGRASTFPSFLIAEGFLLVFAKPSYQLDLLTRAFRLSKLVVIARHN